MRTVSMSHSAMATPKTGTLSSRDLHLGHHLSLSSGSRIINPERISMEEIHKQNGKDAGVHTETHDGPTPSQSRSLQTFHLGDENKNEVLQMNATFVDMEGNYDNLMKHRPSTELRTEVIVDTVDQIPKLDASSFMLTKDRNSSTPAFPVSEQTSNRVGVESVDIKLSRSPEMENIPEMIEDGGLEVQKLNRPGLQHSQSATVSDKSHPSQNLGLALVQPVGDDKLSPCLSPLIARSTAFTTAQDDSFHMDLSFQDSQRKMTPQETSVEFTDSRVSTPFVPLSRKSDAVDETGRSRVGAPVVFSVAANKPDVTIGNGSIPSSSQQIFVSTAYYIAKELLMTERTYKKDLEIITVWFRNAMSRDDVLISNRPLDLLFRLFDPLYEFHCNFLKELEARLTAWESKSLLSSTEDQRKIGDLMGRCLIALPRYRDVFEHQDEVLLELDAATHDNPVFEQLFKEFEMQKVCYLPLSTFLLKPYQRLLHYQLILNKFLKFYKPDNPDHGLCEEALSRFSEAIQHYRGKSRSFENLQKLVELQQDLVGIENLILPSREFIREGCLQKLSRKGYHQRMFFLFSDLLVYTSRSATRSLQFSVHGQLDITKMTIDETDPKIAVANSFSIYTGSHCLVVAASSEAEKTKWMEDLQMAIINARRYKSKERSISYPSLKSNSSSEAADETQDASTNPLAFDRPIQHRTNTLMHVCWHRNTSVSMKECSLATRNSLSGFLLRKFKNTSGWQKLWVAFTNFCLFFYKSYQDDFPLASLPLLGYSVQLPNSSDGIQKDFVFKLQFKNHIYFFRAESQYTFDRWMEAIHTATGNAQHLRMFSRMDSTSTTNSGLVDERNA